jgi:hypothetical protein
VCWNSFPFLDFGSSCVGGQCTKSYLCAGCIASTTCGIFYFDFCVYASFISLEAVVRSIFSLSCVRKICEDGSPSVGLEVYIPFSSFPGYGFTRIFWGCHLNECLAHLDCAALQAVLFLQHIYGFTVFDYSYGGMVLYQSLASSAIETASNIVHLGRHFCAVKNSLIMNNLDLIARKSILTKNDIITRTNEQATY